MAEEEKIKTSEILKVSKHGSGHYLRIPRELIRAFAIRKGDLLRVDINALIREGQTKNVTEPMKGYVSKKPEGGVE